MHLKSNKTVYDCIVVGSGILGSFHAYYAAELGYNVLLLEKDEKPNKATVQNFGMIATGSIASSGAWEWFASHTNIIYRKLDREIEGGISLRKDGSYLVASDEKECAVLKEICRVESGISYMDHDDICRSVPYLNASYARCGLFFPADMSLDPKQFIHTFHRHIGKKENLKILYHSPVMSVKKKR